MRRLRVAIATGVALVAAVLPLAACGGGDDDGQTTTSPAPSSGLAPPGGGGTPPSAGALPPALMECYEDRGYEIESPADIHSAPPQVVNECFGALHQGSGTP
jgi:hypothetical protein